MDEAIALALEAQTSGLTQQQPAFATGAAVTSEEQTSDKEFAHPESEASGPEIWTLVGVAENAEVTGDACVGGPQQHEASSSDDLVRNLIEMGFNSTDAEAAVAACGNVVAEAIDYLTQKNNS